MSKVYEIVTEQVLAALDRGTVPWSRPWNLCGGQQNLDGRSYRGINPLLLEIASHLNGFDKPYWATFKQAQKYGGQVRKGSKSTLITFWKSYLKEDENGDEQKRFMLRYFKVFNVAQIDGLKWEEPVTVAVDHDPIAAGESLIASMPNAPLITVKATDTACYIPALDAVMLPELGQYPKAEDYYRIAFHELAHSTGHEKRLARNLKFHGEEYAAEELVAELSAAMLCAVTRIASDVEQSAAYIAGWRKALTADPKMIISAASKAQKAADCIRGVEQ